ncbi:methyl-accepting chemotaxis protein [Defluviitalea phaphyphila]|uniref:methyl-accepting chemotaxis protein n=1 Tax=Defluviitalea phaphyphila TaxID=1473580 RepID=UPI0007314C78|nr:methyl-accepting chemotaxis protein [Defluviitalea phaphyphila]
MKRKDVVHLILIIVISILPMMILEFFGIELFKDNTTRFFSLLIFGIYMWALCKVLIPIFKINKELNNVLTQIEYNDSFQKIASIIGSTNYLNILFSQFKKSLRPIEIGIDSEENAGAVKTDYYATVEAENYFNEQTLIFDNIISKTINFMPQVLTGLGIFGTFLGIVQGVSDLGGEMTSTEIQGAIGTLLGGVKVSFTTSLCGISFSLALTIVTKLIFDWMNLKIIKLNKIIDSSLNKNNEKEGLKELEKELEKQTAAVERLATDISEDLGKKIDNSLQENMNLISENIVKLTEEIKKSFEGSVIDKIAPALDKLSIVSEELGKMQQTSTNQFITDAISRIEQVISAGTQNEITKLKQTMEIMTEKNNEFIMKFIDGMNGIEKLFQSQQQLIEHTNNSAKSVNITTQNINELQDSLNILLTDMEALHRGSSTSIEDIHNLYEKLKVLSSEQGKLSMELSEMINKAHEYGKMQELYMGRLQETTATIDSSIKNSMEYIKEITENIKEYDNNFKSIRDTTLNIAEKLNNSYTDIINKLQDSSELLNESIEKVDTDIVSNVSELGNRISSTSERLSELCDDMERLSNKFEHFTEVEKSTQEVWMNYEKNFKELNENINDGIINYTSLIKKGTYDIFKNYDEKVAEAVRSLQSMIESIDNTLEDLGEIFGDMLEQMNSKINEAS